MTTLIVHKGVDDFETLYLHLREKEKRIYTDEEVALLPEIGTNHPHFEEWQRRKLSCERLVSYVLKKQSRERDKESIKILEIGCGNGWLSHRLSGIPGTNITGTDVNFAELQQGAKVFRDKANLHFIYSHPESDVFEESQFDMIVFAASIQYFASLKQIMGRSLPLLRQNGEIHIIDSYFYHASEINAAKKRSQVYFESAGFPGMINWYFHRNWGELSPFNHSILYNPNNLFNKLAKNQSPFPWIRIKV